MISLLSPCTLPVIPLLFAGFQGQRKHILALLAGMIVMFTLVAMVVTVASEWIADATVIGRWIALLILSIAAGSDLPAVCSAHCPSGGQCGKRSQHPQRSATRLGFGFSGRAGRWTSVVPCAGPILGAIFSINIAGHSAIATGALLAAYGSGCALMLGLLVAGP